MSRFVSRRGFVKGAAGLLVSAGAGELLLPERRIWALGRWKEQSGAPDNDGPVWWERSSEVSLDLRYWAQFTPGPFVLARAEDVESIPAAWREYPVYVDSLVPYGTVYLADDPWVVEKLKADRAWFDQARSAE